ncbi:restriction endonuclease subunit S [Prevotella sp.]|uniref:restriction endonuclease subunit S n=1 Tax=Prevotella sp. TaxID=59823 RepID=UPI00307BF210
MNEWRKCPIGNVVTLRQGFAINAKSKHYMSDTPTRLPLLRIADMKSGKKEIFVKEDIPQRFIASNEDIIYTRTGNVGLVFRNKYGVVHNNCFTVTPQDEREISRDFLYYALKDKNFYDKANALARGAAQPDLPHSSFCSIELSFPSLSKQHRIATILSRYDSLIDNYQKQIKLLEEAAQRLYKEWFVNLRFPGHENTKIVDGVPEGWEKKKLISLVDVQYGYAFDGHLFNDKGEGMPILRIRNIPDGYTKDYTAEQASSDYIVHKGDIVVGMDGIFHINTWSGDDAYLVQRACSFRPHNEKLKGFIFQAIVEPIKFFEKTLVGATVAHLGKKHIDSIELLVPSKERLFAPLQKMYKQRMTLLFQLRLLAESRDRLLPKLLSGEIEV